MKEIEIKIEIGNIGKIIELLEGKGCAFSDAIHQLDVIYIPQSENTLPVAPGVNVLRIRTQKDKTLFTLKRSDSDNHLAKTEKELEIGHKDTMHDVIELLGYHEISRVDKMRRKCEYRGYEICIDEVKGLGSFLEIEKITDEDPGLVQEAMMSSLKELGIESPKRVGYGYDVLMYQRNGQGNGNQSLGSRP